MIECYHTQIKHITTQVTGSFSNLQFPCFLFHTEASECFKVFTSPTVCKIACVIQSRCIYKYQKKHHQYLQTGFLSLTPTLPSSGQKSATHLPASFSACSANQQSDGWPALRQISIMPFLAASDWFVRVTSATAGRVVVAYS